MKASDLTTDGHLRYKTKKVAETFCRSVTSLITMSPLLLHHLPDTLPHSWQQQTKRADFSGLRRGRSAFDLSPLRRRESGGESGQEEEGKVTSKYFTYILFE